MYDGIMDSNLTFMAHVKKALELVRKELSDALAEMMAGRNTTPRRWEPSAMPTATCLTL